MGVKVDVDVWVGDPVLVGVSVGVQDMIGLGTGSRRSWQPLAKSMITPKSLLSHPGQWIASAPITIKVNRPDIAGSMVERTGSSNPIRGRIKIPD